MSSVQKGKLPKTPSMGASAAPPDQARPSQVDEELAVLRRIMEATSRTTGKEFFHSLVTHLAAAIDVRYAFVAEYAEVRTRVRTIAFWAKDQIVDNIEWELHGTPCEDVVRGDLCHHPKSVARLFPEDKPLVEMGIESYLGVPLTDGKGNVMGHLAVFDERPMDAEPRKLFIFRIFAARAAAELERLRMEDAVRHSEKMLRDLFDEAPIPYVYEETNTRFVSANRAFMNLLGLQPGDVPGTYGMSLVAKTDEAQKRIAESLAAEQVGKELGAILLELRRKDNGNPVWVQRWSKPEPDGKHTRTMIVDVTAQVLAERENARLQQQNTYLQEEIKTDYNFEEIVGQSKEIRRVFKQVEQVASTDSTVLILGETGTGKELIARAIHNISNRKDRPLIKLNCAALPTGLVESELFGHEKGAFTGASEKRLGRFALADGGTIFLDEIGDVPADVQVRLLRVLQEQEFEAVGSTRTQRVDVRVIAATNRDLKKAVADGTFRADLYYRLNVFPVLLPSLAQRREDIPLLVHYFVSKYAMKIGRRIAEIKPDTLQRLMDYPWPGNIRELENVIERAVILSPGPVLEVDADVLRAPAMAGAANAAGAQPEATGGTLADTERRQIVAALKASKWVIEGEQGAAKRLGLHPNTLRSRLKKLGIQRDHEAS